MKQMIINIPLSENIVAGLYAHPLQRVASHALGLWQWTETRAQIKMV